jgi:hypothetical protein
LAQYNVNPPDDYRRDSGMGTVLAVLLVLALVAFLIWALAFGGFNSLTGAPSAGTTPSYSTTTGTGGAGATTGGTGARTGSGATSGATTGTGGTTGGTTTRP